MKGSDDFNLDGTNTAINKNRVWGKIDGHISLTNNKTENRLIKCCGIVWGDEVLRCLICDENIREPKKRQPLTTRRWLP